MLNKNDIKNMFAKSLSASGRINRMDHFLRKFFLLLATVIITIIAVIVISIIARLLGEQPQVGMSLTIDFFFMVLFFIYVYLFGFLWNVLTVLRLHDMNLDGRWCILNFIIFIPMLMFLFRIVVPQPGEFPLSYTLPISFFTLFNIILLFIKGSPGENHYGPPPSDEEDETPSPYLAQRAARQSVPAGPAAKARQAQSVPRTTPNPYAAQPAAAVRPKPGIARPTPSGGKTGTVDKNYIKHNDRYQPKSARKK